MLDDIFSFIDPIMESIAGDLSDFIAQLEDLFESPEQFKASVSEEFRGNPYELYLLLQRLKGGGINFDEFIVQASEWAKRPFAEHFDSL